MFRLSSWLRRQWPNLMLGSILLGLICNALLSAMGPRDLFLLRGRRAELEAKRADLMVRQTELETSVQNLRSNDRYLEHLIRKELGYARPDEMIYKFTRPGAGSDSQTENLNQTARSKSRQLVLAGLTLELLSELGVTHR
jgi:cell division protein FtsB